MFAGAVAGIDERQPEVLHNFFDSIGFRVTHDDEIAVSVEHFTDVGK